MVRGFQAASPVQRKGELVDFVLTRANVDDREESVIDTLTGKVFGKLYADKGYISQSLFGHLWDRGVHIVTWLRSNMRQRLTSLYDRIMLRKRSVIESINDMLKNVARLVHPCHRSVHNFIMNRLAAMGAYCFSSQSRKSISTTRCLTQTDSSFSGDKHGGLKNQANRAVRLITYVIAGHIWFMFYGHKRVLPNNRQCPTDSPDVRKI